ncbi:unnamed protein product [Linum trigynum]|uniref:GDSL esterase/lipase n=1 Tax=Linum trigynum TaxID=586398 RepID=A0AAV2F1A7_9ROSI
MSIDPLFSSAKSQQLYKEGAKFFWVHNTGPLGCLPYSVIYNSDPNNLDGNGCVKSRNNAAQEFNRQLERKLSQLKEQLPHSSFTYVDVYSAKYRLISTAENQGFVHPMEFCCGSYYGYHIDCGKKAVVNGTVYVLGSLLNWRVSREVNNFLETTGEL